MVTRFTLLKELSAFVPDDVLVLTSIGNNSGFWGQLKDREANLFHLTMGMCSSTALRLALALPKRKIVAVDRACERVGDVGGVEPSEECVHGNARAGPLVESDDEGGVADELVAPTARGDPATAGRRRRDVRRQPAPGSPRSSAAGKGWLSERCARCLP